MWFVYNQTVNTDLLLEKESKTGRFIIRPKTAGRYPKNI